MADLPETTRLALPLLTAGQAQKEITHNEALTLVDALLFPMVEATGLNTPPSAPVTGQCWLVGTTPTGAWAGMAYKLALWTSAGWRFAALPQGARVAVGSNWKQWNRSASGWQAPPSVAAPAGGITVDGECRAALIALIQALRVAGLIADT
ncbi:MAG: DUF2793 domain-containing protein [Sphingopyxis sp.]